MRKARDHASRKGTTGFVADQMRWNAALSSAHRSPICMSEAMYKFLLESSMAAVAWSSQANGFFTKLCRTNGIPDESIRKHPYFSETNLQRFWALRNIAAAAGITVTEAVLLYLLCQDLKTIPVVGSYTIEHLADSLSVADKTLAPDVFRAIVDAVGPDTRDP
jgi:aryl-alcohol dehydrogenase-like predicted oxidoreductase